jgi:Restriction alleviation protein Lar
MTTWRKLDGNAERIGDCASADCRHIPAFRYDRGGISSDYCTGCASKIAAQFPGQLSPCPFCGGAAWFDNAQSGGSSFECGRARTFWSVRCKTCDVRTPAIANAISPVMIWNTRK